MDSIKDIVQALLDLGLTQTKIADDSGVTQPTISRVLAGNGVSYENGKKIEVYYQLVRDSVPTADRRTAPQSPQQKRETSTVVMRGDAPKGLTA